MNKALPRAVTFACISVLITSWIVYHYSDAYRDHAYAGRSLAQLAAVQTEKQNDPLFLYYFGKKLNQAGRFADAEAVMQRCVGLDPEPARFRDEWAQALLGSGNMSGAFGELRQFVGTHPRNAEAHRLIGKFYLTQQSFQPARQALQRSVDLDRANAESWSLLGQTLIKLGRYADASAALRRALGIRQSAADHLQLAVLLMPSNPAEARAEFVEAVAGSPRDSTAHREYARFLFASRSFADAEREARTASQLQPADAFSMLILARSLRALSRNSEAVTVLTAASRTAPDDPVIWQELSGSLRAAGIFAAAREAGRRSASLYAQSAALQTLKDRTFAHPADTSARERYAAALAVQGNVEECLRQHAIARATTRDNPRVLTDAARDMDAAGRSRDALPLVRQALGVTQQSPDSLEVCGTILAHLGRLKEAEADFERIRDWRPDDRAKYVSLLNIEAQRIERSRRPEEILIREAANSPIAARAAALLERAALIDPTNTRCLRALLRLKFALNDPTALPLAERLTAISPEDGFAHSLAVILSLQRNQGTLAPGARGDLQAHLSAASLDAGSLPTYLYAKGLFDLREGDARGAVRSLRRAASLEPESPAVYVALSSALHLAGDEKGSRQFLALANQYGAPHQIRLN